MCRLFGMSAMPHRVHATFWLLDAADSLARQSRREPDGTGLGTFTEDGSPLVEKQPLAAYEDREFAAEAMERCSATFLAHIRFASTGAVSPVNTHPFSQRGRLFAHNGVIADLPSLEEELGPYRDLVVGDTDSERFFALITRCIDDHAGDVTAGITAAARWVAENLRMYSINLVLTTATEMWALRYPEANTLFVLQRSVGGTHGNRHLEHASGAGTVRARSGELARYPAVVVASERMDEDPGWAELRSGELLHVDGGLGVSRTLVLERPPRHLLGLGELGHHAAASQAGT